MGKLLKGALKFTVAAAAVGGICYAFKDKIKESKVYKDYNVDDKITKVKTTIKDKMPKVFDNEEDYVDDEEIFFDDLDAESVSRDYVSINPEETPEPETEEVSPAETEAPAAEISEATADDEVPTIEI